MKNRSGQVSVEFMLLIALVLLIFIPIFILVSRAGLDTADQVSGEQVGALARSILDEARETYYLGDGSRQRITLDIPETVESIMVIEATPDPDDGSPEIYELAIVFTQNGNQNTISSVSEVSIRINETQRVACDVEFEPSCGSDYSCVCSALDPDRFGLGARDIELRTNSTGGLHVGIAFR